CMVFFIVCIATATMATLVYVPRMADSLRERPWLFAIAVLHMLAVANVPREINAGRDFRAFLSSATAMATLMTLYGLGMFPNLVYDPYQPENSLTIYNSASSGRALWIMLFIAGLGVPVVLTYTVTIYWVFRGKVELDKMSY